MKKEKWNKASDLGSVSSIRRTNLQRKSTVLRGITTLGSFFTVQFISINQ